MQKERNWFIEQLQLYAKAHRTRITFLSGDVHCAAVGVLKTFVKGKNAPDVPPPGDFRYMINVVTSASPASRARCPGLMSRARRDREHAVSTLRA